MTSQAHQSPFHIHSSSLSGGEPMQTVQTRDGPISLLFSPPTSDPLAEKQSSPLARSATKAARDEVNAPFHPFRDYTPVHRRRNTPSSSNRQASPLLSGGGPSTSPSPPPPPTMSLFDTAGGEASASPMNVSGGKGQYGDRRQSLGRPPAQQIPVLHHGMRVEDYEDCWVTVYGFHQNDVPLVLKEFSKCGEIVDFGHFTDGPYVNWIHVCFDTKYAAQRALLRSGHQLSPTCMVGVKEIDAGKKERILQSTTAGHSVDAGDDDTNTTARASSYRPASFMEAQKKVERKIVAAEQPVVPLEATSMWEKVCEFVLGI